MDSPETDATTIFWQIHEGCAVSIGFQHITSTMMYSQTFNMEDISIKRVQSCDFSFYSMVNFTTYICQKLFFYSRPMTYFVLLVYCQWQLIIDTVPSFISVVFVPAPLFVISVCYAMVLLPTEHNWWLASNIHIQDIRKLCLVNLSPLSHHCIVAQITGYIIIQPDLAF